MIPMPCAHARLLPHQSGNHFELLTVHIPISIQVEHAKGNLKVATGDLKRQILVVRFRVDFFIHLFHLLESTVSRKM